MTGLTLVANGGRLSLGLASLHSYSLAPSNREQSSGYTRITILLKGAAGKRVGKTRMDINLNLLVIDCSVRQLIDLNLHDVLRRSS